MSDLDVAVEKMLDEDDDLGSEKEEDTMDKNPTYKFLEPFLGEAIALLREGIKLHTTQNIRLGSQK